MTMIQVEHLCKRFGNVEVLSDISMEVKKGDFSCDYRPIRIWKIYSSTLYQSIRNCYKRKN